MALYSDPDETWALAVGRFVLAFTDIERTSIACLARIPRKALPKPESMSLARRLRRLVEELEPIQHPSARELLGAIVTIQRFVASRNILAHTALGWAASFSDDGSGKATYTLHLEPAITVNSDPAVTLRLDDILRLAEIGEDLAWRFTTSAAAAFAALPWVDYEP